MPIDVVSYGPWAVIAGGSEGIGVSFARKLAAAGINLVLVARKQEPMEHLARELRARHGAQVRVLSLDLSQPDMLDRVSKLTEDVEVGFLVFNTGASYGFGNFLQVPLANVLKMIRVSPQALLSLVHHFGTRMLARGRGGIVVMGSMSSVAGTANMAGYGAVKAFSQIFAEGLWAELKPLGVDVLYAVLGATETPARARVLSSPIPGEFVASPDDVAQECLDNLKNGPVLVPAHLAEAFKYFSSLPRRQATEEMTAMLQRFKS
jgi:short-subunit dehydrogenase